MGDFKKSLGLGQKALSIESKSRSISGWDGTLHAGTTGDLVPKEGCEGSPGQVGAEADAPKGCPASSAHSPGSSRGWEGCGVAQSF